MLLWFYVKTFNVWLLFSRSVALHLRYLCQFSFAATFAQGYIHPKLYQHGSGIIVGYNWFRWWQLQGCKYALYAGYSSMVSQVTIEVFICKSGAFGEQPSDGVGKARLLQFQHVYKSIYEPCRIIGSYLLLQRAEEHLLPVGALEKIGAGSNKLHIVIYTFFASVLRVVHSCLYLVEQGRFFHRLKLCVILRTNLEFNFYKFISSNS